MCNTTLFSFKYQKKNNTPSRSRHAAINTMHAGVVGVLWDMAGI